MTVGALIDLDQFGANDLDTPTPHRTGQRVIGDHMVCDKIPPDVLQGDRAEIVLELVESDRGYPSFYYCYYPLLYPHVLKTKLPL